MGVTFKENVSDIRNSKVVDIINELKDFGVSVDVMDPCADIDEVYRSKQSVNPPYTSSGCGLDKNRLL